MGTNYYAVRNRPTVREPIHIGKSSIGWRFLFQEQNDPFYDPPIEWHSYPDVIRWLYVNVESKKEFIIMDEYDHEVTFKQFVDLVVMKQEEPWCDSTYVKNVNGYRFCEEEFS